MSETIWKPNDDSSDIYVDLSPSELRRFKRNAKQAGLSLSDWMAQAIRKGLERDDGVSVIQESDPPK